MLATLPRIALTLIVVLIGPQVGRAFETVTIAEPIAHQGIAGTLLLSSRHARSHGHCRAVRRRCGQRASSCRDCDEQITNPAVVVLREQLQAAKIARLSIVARANAAQHADVQAASGLWLFNVDKLTRSSTLVCKRISTRDTRSPSPVVAPSKSCERLETAPRRDRESRRRWTRQSPALLKQLSQAPGTFGLLIESSSATGPNRDRAGARDSQLGTGRVRFVLAASKTRPIGSRR